MGQNLLSEKDELPSWVSKMQDMERKILVTRVKQEKDKTKSKQ